MREITEDRPEWISEDGHIIEPAFCESFLAEHQLKCIRGRFCTVDGPVPDEGSIRREVWELVSEWQDAGLSKKVDSLMNSLRTSAYSEPPAPQTDRIHFANGTYFVRSGEFTERKEFCVNRLAVSYNPDAPKPERWDVFLRDLLEEEDIQTLQEYLGYCLIPTTKGQKMLMIIGRGGEGKSRIGLVMNAVFGEAMNTTSIQKIEKSKFSRADLENKLLMVDDDMDISALPKTNYIKSLVTSECRMDVERKGIQSYQSLLYARFLCFGNGALTALHDRSDGFFRRQIVLTTKEKPKDREDDPYLAEKLIAEKESIVLWCLEGLDRLMKNGFRFTVSERARGNVNRAMRESDNVVDFLNSTGYLRFKADADESTRRLYEAYKIWCEDNAEAPLTPKSFANHLSTLSAAYRLEDTDKVRLGNGKYCRGYWGVEVLIRLAAV